MAVSGSFVYVAGDEINENGRTIPVYWKNGIKTILSENHGTANSIAVTGSTVYIAGREAVDNINTAVYWRNGKIAILPRGEDSTSSTASAIIPVKKK
jgi:hypothetical protein